MSTQPVSVPATAQLGNVMRAAAAWTAGYKGQHRIAAGHFRQLHAGLAAMPSRVSLAGRVEYAVLATTHSLLHRLAARNVRPWRSDVERHIESSVVAIVEHFETRALFASVSTADRPSHEAAYEALIIRAGDFDRCMCVHTDQTS